MAALRWQPVVVHTSVRSSDVCAREASIYRCCIFSRYSRPDLGLTGASDPSKLDCRASNTYFGATIRSPVTVYVARFAV